MARRKLEDLPDLRDLARSGGRVVVRVAPGAARDGIRQDGELLRVMVTAPAEAGKANAAARKVVAAALGVAPSRLALVRGHKAREKVFEVTG